MNMAVSQAREELAELVNLVHYRNERVLLLRHGRPVAALISAEDLELFEHLENAADLRAIEEALADPESQGPPIPWEEVEAELDRLDEQQH
jgi:prevent-host-death family protein